MSIIRGSFLISRLQQSELNLRESSKKIEEVVHHLEGELLKARKVSVQSQEGLRNELVEERCVCVCVCARSFVT